MTLDLEKSVWQFAVQQGLCHCHLKARKLLKDLRSPPGLKLFIWEHEKGDRSAASQHCLDPTQCMGGKVLRNLRNQRRGMGREISESQKNR